MWIKSAYSFNVLTRILAAEPLDVRNGCAFPAGRQLDLGLCPPDRRRSLKTFRKFPERFNLSAHRRAKARRSASHLSHVPLSQVTVPGQPWDTQTILNIDICRLVPLSQAFFYSPDVPHASKIMPKMSKDQGHETPLNPCITQLVHFIKYCMDSLEYYLCNSF